MTDSDTPKPLTADEIAHIFSREARVMYRALIAENGFLPGGDARFLMNCYDKLIAIIEQRNEQIEKLRSLEKENARILGFLANELQGRIEGGKLGALVGCLERSQEALAATEPTQ